MLLAPSPAVLDPPAGGDTGPEEPPGYGEADFAKSMAAAFKDMGAPEKPKAADAPTVDPPPEKKPDAPPVEKKEDKAPDKAGDKLADKGADDPEGEKWPRTSEDWKKFKAKHGERETALKKQNEEVANRVKELEAQLAETAKRVETAPDTDKLVQAAVAEKDALLKQLEERIAELDITKDPRFEKYFGDRTKAVQDRANTLLGNEKGAAFIKLLALPDGDYKNEKLSEFYAELDPRMTGRLTAIEDNLVTLESEKAAAIAEERAKADQRKGERTATQKTQAEQQQKAYETAYKATLARLQDPEKGLAVFQKRDGDEAWNKGVGERIGQVMDLLTKAGPERAIEGAFRAVALQSVLNSFGAASKAWGEEKKALEAKVAALTAAQPGGGKGGANGDGNGGDTIKRDDSPDSVLKRMARSTIAAWNQQ